MWIVDCAPIAAEFEEWAQTRAKWMKLSVANETRHTYPALNIQLNVAPNNCVERKNVVTSAIRYQFVLLDELYCVLECVPTIIWLTSNAVEPNNSQKKKRKTSVIENRRYAIQIHSCLRCDELYIAPTICATFAPATWTPIRLNCFRMEFLISA